MGPLLVADIGGTNARFGLMYKPKDGNSYQMAAPRTLRCDSFESLAEMVLAYCNRVEITAPRYACFAVAGPVKDDAVQMTNRDWYCCGNQLRATLEMSVVKIINDYAALAYATSHFDPEDAVTLFEAPPDPSGVIAVMGPGTGFGVAALMPGKHTSHQVIASEGGHVAFAPTTDIEIELLKYFRRTRSHVSVEDILSGPGLIEIYRALAHISDMPAKFQQVDKISANGLSGEDKLCEETLTIFCNLLGSVAGDKALDFCSRGGVYIGGGIAPRFDGFLQRSDFLARFQNKGAMSDFVSQIPIHLVKTDNAALIGCAAWLENFIPQQKL